MPLLKVVSDAMEKSPYGSKTRAYRNAFAGCRYLIADHRTSSSAPSSPKNEASR
jgi:hypothetical protein